MGNLQVELMVFTVLSIPSRPSVESREAPARNSTVTSALQAESLLIHLIRTGVYLAWAPTRAEPAVVI